MSTPTTIALLLRSVGTALSYSGIFGDKAEKLTPILSTIAALAEVPEALEPERQALLAMVDTWVKENRPPSDEELEKLKATRDSLHERAAAALAALPPKGSKAAPLIVVLFLGALALAGLATRAEAQVQTGTLKVEWVNPTTYTDASALPSSEIVANRVVWGTCAGSAFTKAGEHKLARATTDTITGLTLGGTYCVGVFVTAQKTGGQQVESAMTNPYSFTFPAPSPVTPTPGTPTTVTVTCTVNGQNVTCAGTFK